MRAIKASVQVTAANSALVQKVVNRTALLLQVMNTCRNLLMNRSQSVNAHSATAQAYSILCLPVRIHMQRVSWYATKPLALQKCHLALTATAARESNDRTIFF